MTATDTTAAADATFSAILRERTADDHSGAERSPFMAALLDGRLSREGYIDMLAQHWYLYDALEGQLDRLRTDESLAPFLDPALERLDALSADLLDLAGPDWQDAYPASEASVAYAARVREVAQTWPAGYVAHHYTRYMGDLSGGQFIGRIAAQAYDLTPENGGRFARFDGIEDLKEYRDQYRAHLDAAPWDTEELNRVVDEIHQAYRFNGEVFEALQHHAS